MTLKIDAGQPRPRARATNETKTAQATATKRMLERAEIERRTPDADVAPGVARNLESVKNALASNRTRALSKGVNDKLQLDPATLQQLSADSPATPKHPVPDNQWRPSGPFEKMRPIDKQIALEQARRDANYYQDPSKLDQVDAFRNRLSPAEQAEYDRRLEQLRNDPRINITGPNGEPVDLATRDLVLRGMLAASWGNPQALEDTIQTAVNSKIVNGQVVQDGQGTFDVIVYPGDFDIKDHTYPNEPGKAPGLATRDGDMVISEAFLYNSLANNDNLIVHEFSHCMAKASRSGGPSTGSAYPADFPYQSAVDDAYTNNPEFQQYVLDRFGKLHEPGAERWATINTMFRTDPAKLKELAPELYAQMVQWAGFDPLTGKDIPADQVTRNPPACPAEPPPPRDDDDRPWWKRIIDGINPFG